MTDGGVEVVTNPGHEDVAGNTSSSPTGLRRWLTPLLWSIAVLVTFLVYWRVSRVEAGDVYSGVFTLQGQDMLRGNLLLHGWTLSDVSFYTTEVPEYALVVWQHGVNSDVVHICAAITYTLVLLLVALLAKGRATGRQAAVRIAIAIGIMCAPQIGPGLFVSLLAPDHLGSCVPVLAAWLILERARPRWWVPAAVGALLAWVLIADSVALLTAVLPLVVVCSVRAYRKIIQQGLRWQTQWYEISLAGAALAAEAVAHEALKLIRAHGGFYVHPVGPSLSNVYAFPKHLLLELEGIFLLFGADFFGHKIGVDTSLLLLHLVGLSLAVWAVGTALRRRGRGIGLVPQLLLVGMAINLIAFPLWGTLASDVTSSREMVAILPFGALLAARLLADRLTAAKLLPALAVVLLGYLISLGSVAVQPIAAPRYSEIGSWLAAHHLRYGLGPSGLASVATVASGEQTQIRPVVGNRGYVVRSSWESQRSWYSARRHDADFLVQFGHPPGASPTTAQVLDTFGRPGQTYHVGPYTILVWDHNLLSKLHWNP
jgi:hypothetical protein